MNVSEQMEEKLKDEAESGKRLLLHSCCAPCSSYVLTYLRNIYRITVFYYNPNITSEEEYKKREAEEIRFIGMLNEECKDPENKAYPIEILKAEYHPDDYLTAVVGYEDCPERGARCEICFRLRLSETAKKAAEGGFDYFATTLTLSPLKNAELINEIGKTEGEKAKCVYLPSDFKKKGGYLRSIEHSKEYGLYRQDFCGCDFSKKQREKEKALKDANKEEKKE